VSWISTEDPDRAGDVVVARGMNDSQFRLNPIVTLNHCYTAPPVGRSLWRKYVRDGELRGIKAKTQYPSRPADWQGDWPPDVAFTLVQAELLRGKSIGFLPIKVHLPAEEELQRNKWAGVNLVIDEWILLEYACVFLPAQQNAVVSAVSKSAAATPSELQKALALLPSVPFITLADMEKEISQAVSSIDLLALADKVAQDRLDRLRGRV
jgi:hypothetical protein